MRYTSATSSSLMTGTSPSPTVCISMFNGGNQGSGSMKTFFNKTCKKQDQKSTRCDFLKMFLNVSMTDWLTDLLTLGVVRQKNKKN